MLNFINQISYGSIALVTLPILLLLCFSKIGKYRIWNPNEMKPMSNFNWICALICTGTGVCLLGVAPFHLEECASGSQGAFTSYMCWTLLYWSIFTVWGILEMRYYKTKLFKVLNVVSLVGGLCVSIPLASQRFLNYFGADSNAWYLMLPMILLVSILAFLSIKYKLLLKYSRINIYMLIALIVMVSGTASVVNFLNPFQGITNIFSYHTEWGNLGWLTDQDFLAYIASTLSWTPFVGRFLVHTSNGRSLRSYILGSITFPSIITVIWMAVAQNANLVIDSTMKLTFTGILFILTMIMFLVTTLDSTAKTLIVDLFPKSSKTNKKKYENIFLPIYFLLVTAISMIVIYNNNLMNFISVSTYYTIIPYWVACIYCIILVFNKKFLDKSGMIHPDTYNKIISNISMN